MPADPQAQRSPGSPAGRGRERQPEILPRHRFGPHAKHAKEAACGCAGCYTAYAAIELYAEAFEQRNALDKLEAFASCNGPDFYGLPRNSDRITLVREEWTAPATLPLGEQVVVPLRAGEKLRWRLLEDRA